jgi:presenilin-like A22 family membrane protease
MVAEQPLLPLTKLLLIIWALITILGGLLVIFYPPFATAVVYPPPLEPVPWLNAGLYFALSIGSGVASVLALRINRWRDTRLIIVMYFFNAIFAEYVALRRIIQGPVPFQLWFYVILGVFYIVTIPIIWRRQEQGAAVQMPAQIR